MPDWRSPPRPGPDVISGRYIRLERLNPTRHAAPVHDLLRHDAWVWDYMSGGPFASAEDLREWMDRQLAGDQVFYAFVDQQSGRAFGYAAFMRIDAANGVLEIGHVMIAPIAQRGRAASEALMAMIGWAFGTGYRRVEWKCNAHNLPSRWAAARYGFCYEGIFRNHMILKGRNRDTAWFAMTDADWTDLAKAYADWLDPANFDAEGNQQRSLSVLTAPVVARGAAEIEAILAGKSQV